MNEAQHSFQKIAATVLFFLKISGEYEHTTMEAFLSQARCCMTFTFLPMAPERTKLILEAFALFSSDTADNNSSFVLWSH